MSNAKRRAIISFTIVIVTTLIVAGAVVLKPKASSSSGVSESSPAASTSISSTTNTTPSTSTSTTQPSSTAEYKDGTYTTTATYDTPDGNESMGVSVTVADGTVTNTSATVMSRSHDSRAYQQDFVASYQSSVVGKKLSSLNLRIVAGASLTTAGFNDALDTIRSQAKV